MLIFQNAHFQLMVRTVDSPVVVDGDHQDVILPKAVCALMDGKVKMFVLFIRFDGQDC